MRRSSRRFAIAFLACVLIVGICHHHRNAPGKVEVDYHVIRYTEPAGQIELDWEYSPDEPPVAYVPSARRWRATMPDWARDRRDEIFPFIQRETRHMNFVWEEYD
jgi:hypothetical protein